MRVGNLKCKFIFLFNFIVLATVGLGFLGLNIHFRITNPYRSLSGTNCIIIETGLLSIICLVLSIAFLICYMMEDRK